MKKLFAIIVALALMVSLLPLSTAVFAAQDADSITKSFEEDTYGLCDIVEGTIVVEAGTDTDASGLIVEDIFPAGLTLLDAEITSGGAGDVDVDMETNTLTVTLDDDDTTYLITFWAEVTYAKADEPIEVTNTATVYDNDGYDYENRMYGESAEATLTVEPYEALDKHLEASGLDYWWDGGYGISESFDPADEIPVSTKVYFLIYLDLENTLDVEMLDARIVDNLPGNVEYVDWYTYEVGTVNDEKITGKTKAAHLTWEIGDLESTEGVISDLVVATDSTTGNNSGKNPKNGKQMKSGPGTYTVNPGATLVFTDGDTGLECAIRSATVQVDVVIPEF